MTQTIGLSLVCLLAISFATGFEFMRSYTEQPEYEVIEQDDRFEIRVYTSRIVAETTVEATTRSEATSEGFRRLAGYIFGNNISMTSPVESEKQSEKIAMTSPVEASEDAPDSWVVVFTMPSTYTLDTLPRPVDERVILREIPGDSMMASQRFSGRVTPERRQEMEAALLERLAASDYEPAGTAIVAVYDAPATPSVFRRNEILIPVTPRP